MKRGCQARGVHRPADGRAAAVHHDRPHADGFHEDDVEQQVPQRVDVSITLPPSLMTVTLSRNWRIQPRASINTSAFSVAVSNGARSAECRGQHASPPGYDRSCGEVTNETFDCRSPPRTVNAWRCGVRAAMRGRKTPVRPLEPGEATCEDGRFRFLPRGQQTVSTATAIVMAAGKGIRMKSELPKVLVPVCGRPMIDYVLDALAAAGVTRTIVVVGYRADDVRRALAGRDRVEFALQAEQRGTGHAVMCCARAVAKRSGAVLVVAGDSPMMQPSSIRSLLAEFERMQPACLLGTGTKDNPRGLGRMVRDAGGRFVGIVEEKDATNEQKQIREVNLSCYVFNCPIWLSLGPDSPRQCPGRVLHHRLPGRAVGRGQGRAGLERPEACEALSINNLDELAAVETAMRAMGFGPRPR